MDHMEFSISLPPYVEFTNAGMEWASMKQRLNTHGSYSSDTHNHHDGLVKAFLINIAVEQVQEIFNMFGLSYDEALKFSQILQRLEDVCVPRFLIIYNRYKFFTCRQSCTDKFDDFLRDLLNWSENCEFGDLRDILLKDCIITGIPDGSVRQRLLETEELDFTKTIDICRAVEKRQKPRNAIVNTNQIIFVDASMETEELDKSPIKSGQIQETVKEFSDASTNTMPDDFSIEINNAQTANFVKDNVKFATLNNNNSVEPDDNISFHEPVDLSDIAQDCETENNNNRPCADYEVEGVTSEKTKSLRRSKRSKKLDGSSFKSRLKINKPAGPKNEKESKSRKKLKLVQIDPVLSTATYLNKKEDNNSINKFKIIRSDIEIQNTADQKNEVECSNKKNKKLINTQYTINKSQDHKVMDSITGNKTIKLSQKTLVHKRRSGNHKEGTNIAKDELICSFCGQNFPDKVSILSHVQETHGRKNFRKVSLKCRICKAVFIDLATLRKHRLVHKNEKKFKCDFCPTHFGNPSHLKVHMRLHTGERPYTCETCGASYPEASKLKAHMRKHTGEKPYHCSVCNRTFAWTAAYTRHMRIHTGERPYTCEFCGVNFADFTSLQRHIRTHTLEKPYHCDKCNAKFTDPSALKLHNRTHNGERPYVCGTCKKSFIRSQHLKEHLKMHTGEKPFSCETCGAKFLEASKLKSHCRKHTGEKPYLCKICGTRFAWTAAFTRHMRTHTLEKPYVCEFCDSCYADHSTLTRHKRTHTGERPYPCKICNTNFADNSSLHRHMRIHTGEKSYTCDVCGSSFAVKSYLVRHMRTHTGEKPYSCDLCGSKFTDSSKLKRHTKIHSKAQMKPEKSESKQAQQYEQLQPVQQLPSDGGIQQPPTNLKLDSWTDDQQQLISVMHNLEHPILITTTLLPLNNTQPYGPSIFSES